MVYPNMTRTQRLEKVIHIWKELSGTAVLPVRMVCQPRVFYNLFKQPNNETTK